MALTKITSRILDSSGVTILGTITTGVWQGTAINQTYLVGQSGTNTGDETLARINALDITELGTVSSGVWNGTVIASAYLDADTAHLSTTQTFTGSKTFSSGGIFSSSSSQGKLKLVAGSNEYLSLEFANASGTTQWEISKNNTHDLYFYKGGYKMILKSDGNVGIGTTAPVKTLDVQGQLAISNNASSYWYLDRNDSSGNFDIINDSNQVKLTISSGGAIGQSVTPISDPYVAGAEQWMTYQIGKGGIIGAYKNNNESMFGFNTYVSAPSGLNKAVISGINGTAIRCYADRITFNHLTSSGTSQTQSTKLTISSGGNVGIGTTSPSRELHIEKSTDNCVISAVSGTTRLAGLVMGDTADDDRGAILYNNNGDYLYFISNGSQKLTIGSNWTHNLDAYEEGTYTATMTPNTSGTITLNNKTLSYTRIGRVVHVTGYLDFASVSSPVGSVSINLPFTQATTTENPTACNVRFNGFSNSSYHANTPWAQCSNGVISIYSGNASGVLSNVAQEITTNCSVRIGVTYFTNA